jgi:hypothetical protein
MVAAANDGGGDGVVTHVDIPSLEAEVTRLEGLRDYVAKTLIPHLGTVATTIKSGNVAFGSFAQGQTAATKHDSYFQAVVQSYANVVKQLDDDVQATKTIIDKYKTAETRNAANVTDIEKIFHGADPSSSSSSSSTSGSGL